MSPLPDGPRGYAVRTHALEFAGEAMALQALLDDQQFHDPDDVAARLGIGAASWPLFGQLWPSACVLADHVQTMDLGSRRVLEVGCGLGLASLVAQRRGADVTASDLHPLSEAFLIGNAARNRLATIPFHHGSWADRQVPPGRFGLVLGSDLLYEPQHAGQLAAYIGAHTEIAARVVLVDPGRGAAGRFARHMAALGFVHAFEQVVPRATAGGWFAGKIHSFVRTA